MRGDATMTDERVPTSRAGDYRLARIGAGVALVLAAICVVFIDAFVPSYTADPIILGLLLTTGAGMLGVEGIAAAITRSRGGS